MKAWMAALALGLTVAGCDGGGAEPEATADSEAAANRAGADAPNSADPAPAAGGTAALAGCPFRETQGWIGSIEGGRLLVNGQVDLQMAGFRPTLTERAGAAPGTLALDLTLAPEPNAAVSDLARYERTGAPRYRRGEIWCGDERIADFAMIVID